MKTQRPGACARGKKPESSGVSVCADGDESAGETGTYCSLSPADLSRKRAEGKRLRRGTAVRFLEHEIREKADIVRAVLCGFHKDADCRVLRSGAHGEGFADAEAAGAQGFCESGETGGRKDKVEEAVMNQDRSRGAYEERKGAFPAAGCVIEAVARGSSLPSFPVRGIGKRENQTGGGERRRRRGRGRGRGRRPVR